MAARPFDAKAEFQKIEGSYTREQLRAKLGQLRVPEAGVGDLLELARNRRWLRETPQGKFVVSVGEDLRAYRGPVVVLVRSNNAGGLVALKGLKNTAEGLWPTFLLDPAGADPKSPSKEVKDSELVSWKRASPSTSAEDAKREFKDAFADFGSFDVSTFGLR